MLCGEYILSLFYAIENLIKIEIGQISISYWSIKYGLV